MKAAYIEEPGPAEAVIRYGDLPRPQPQAGQVLVKVGAVAVNPIDTYLRGGANYWPLPRPFILGCDLAGTVVERGPGATRFQVGDRVWGSNQGLMGRQGTFAEYCAVDEVWLYPTPPQVTDEQAAACALVGITAHLGLFREAQLKAGETIFVNGGSGGVGSMVVQMAKIIGARVVATAGGPEKVAFLRQLGVDGAIDYKRDDVAAEVARLAPGGVNVYWETTRQPDFDRIVSYLAERGRIILMAGRDARPPFPVGPFYVKECSMHGFVMFKASPQEQQACADDINRWLAEGKLQAHIARVLPLAEAAAAHKLQEENTVHLAGTLCGKIILKP
jgi:NADPH2:quinone reductase